MKIYLCVYFHNRVIPEDLCSIEHIYKDKKKADKWYDNAIHHGGADLRFWSPIIMEREIE